MTKKAETQPLGFWERFYQILSPRFIDRLLVKPEMSGYSWGFWFLSNTIITLLLTAGIVVGGTHLVKKAPQKIEQALEKETIELAGQKMPALEFVKNAEIKIKNGELSVKNIPDPLVLSGNTNETGNVVVSSEIPEDKQIIAVLDTQDQLEISVDDFQAQAPHGGILIKKNAAFIWDEKKHRLQTIPFEKIGSEDGKPLVLNWNTITENSHKLLPLVSGVAFTLGIFIWIFVALLRLINVLLWTLVFWPIITITKTKNLGFERIFETLLHFGAITFPLAFIGLFVFGSHFWWNFVILACLFGMNIWYIKHKNK